jgi:transposase
MLQGRNLVHAFLHFHLRRHAHHDGATREAGRPSVDPELLLRILLIGYLYGITSERKLVEELRMHLAWRWFKGLSFDKPLRLAADADFAMGFKSIFACEALPEAGFAK